MKITKFETFHVKPRWLFLKISTDEGYFGFGEPIVEGNSKAVEAAVMSFGDRIMGKNPLEIEHLWQLMYRGTFYRGGPILSSAISGIEQALWDIKGKYYKMPIYEMLGGKVRDKIRIYPHLDGTYPNTGDTSTAHYVACALKRKEQGFTALKFTVDGPMKMFEKPSKINAFVEKVRSIRKAVGDDMDIAIDFHGRLSPAMSIQLCKKLEEFDLMFVEEPVLPGNTDALLRLAQSTSIPIATGERLFTRWGFQDIIERQAVAIVQPDACHAGGILEIRKIAAMAETKYMGVAPHNPLGPISLAACLQLDACMPNFVMQECPCSDNGWDIGVEYLKKAFVIKDSYIDVPTGYGLGIEVDEEALKRMAYDGNWKNGKFIDPDDHSVVDY